MNKPKFDPSKPYEVVKASKPKFDKKKPFTEYIVESAEAQEAIEAKQIDDLKDNALLLQHGASMGFSDEIVGGVEAMLGGDYKEERDKFRETLKDARKRQGLLGDTAELAGNVGVTMIPGAKVASTAGKEIALAMAQGLGESDELEDAPKHMLISGGLSAGTQVAGKVAKKMLFDEPDKILARTSGARNMDFLKGRGGDKDPAKVAADLDKIGFFRQGDVVYDTHYKKFIPHPGKSRLETFFKPQSLENLHDRAQIAMTAIRHRKAEILKGKTIPSEKLIAKLDEGLKEFIPKGIDNASRKETAEKIKDLIFEDLIAQGAMQSKTHVPHMNMALKGNHHNKVISATGLDTYKGHLGQEVEKSFIKRLQEVGMDDEAIIKFRGKIDDLLTEYGGAPYKDNNVISHKLNLLSEDAWNKISRHSAEGIEKPPLTAGSLWDKAIDMVNPASVGVGRARIGKEMDSWPVETIRKGFKRAPVELYNNMDRENYVEQNPPMQKQTSVPNIPEQLIRTPLPRSTEGLNKNKPFVLKKVAQMAPEMFEAVKDVYENNPENLGELAQVLAMKMPHFFEKDKYNRFDGRILTEKDKSQAIKDTLLRKDVDAIAQGKIITLLNREGLFEG